MNASRVTTTCRPSAIRIRRVAVLPDRWTTRRAWTLACGKPRRRGRSAERRVEGVELAVVELVDFVELLLQLVAVERLLFEQAQDGDLEVGLLPAELDNAVRDVRSYIFELRPKLVQEHGVAAAVRELVRDFEVNTLGHATVRWDDGAGAKLAEEEQQIARAEERARVLEERVDQLSRELDRFTAHRAIGVSAAWKQALTSAVQVAATDTTVLITGESGTGKEVMARYLHAKSKRAGKAFVSVNCAAIPENLLESELFGHEKGAFTHALSQRMGLCEQAHQGTLFLDEIGDLRLDLQAKLLRAIQEGEIERVGGTKPIKTEFRLIAATNVDLEKAVKEGRFREDLLCRINLWTFSLPGLRSRPEDIDPNLQFELDQHAQKTGHRVTFSKEAREEFLQFALSASALWSGNFRDLNAAVARMAGIRRRDGISAPQRVGHRLVVDATCPSAVANALELSIPGLLRHPDFDLDVGIPRRPQCRSDATERRQFRGRGRNGAAWTLRRELARAHNGGLSDRHV